MFFYKAILVSVSLANDADDYKCRVEFTSGDLQDVTKLDVFEFKSLVATGTYCMARLVATG